MRRTKKKQRPIFSTLEGLNDAVMSESVGPDVTMTRRANVEVTSSEGCETADDVTPVSLADEHCANHKSLAQDALVETAPMYKPGSIPVPGMMPDCSSELTEKPDVPERVMSGSFEDELGLRFVFIEPGAYLMGSPASESGRNDDETLHEISLSQGFYLQVTPITQRQWEAVMGANPSSFISAEADCPVESVSWYDCRQFIQRLNSMGSSTYRLPIEAEWEYACRAGSDCACSAGEVLELFCGLDHNLNTLGYYCGNSGRKTQPVAQKSANAWGLYDMHGNVMEWCRDWYSGYAGGLQKDACGPNSGDSRVVRGGSWFSNAKNCRSASRFYWSPDRKSDFIGFRLVKAQ